MRSNPAQNTVGDDDHAESPDVAHQEGPRTPAAFSTEPTRVFWDSTGATTMTSSPVATPLSATEHAAPALPALSSALLQIPSSDSSSSSSLSSPVTSFFSDSSGATSVSSWSSTTHFPFVSDSEALKQHGGLLTRGFSSDPGKATPQDTTAEVTERRRAGDSRLTETAFNQQPPIPQDFLSPEAPLIAQRNRSARQAARDPLLGSRPRYERHWPPASAPVQSLHIRRQSGSQSMPRAHVVSPQDPLSGQVARDSLLNYAHQLYIAPGAAPPRGLSSVPLEHGPAHDARSSAEGHVYATQLIPLLTSLRALHPQHLPTLLLYGCVLYAMGDFQESLTLNKEILSIDPNYVEAMCNLGTTLKAIGQLSEAESWWWRAVQLRPLYWDAIDNLMGAFLAAPEPGSGDGAGGPPRYDLALALCAYVFAHVPPAVMPAGSLLGLQHLVAAEGAFAGINAGQAAPGEHYQVPPAQLHKLQSLLFYAANLRCLLRGATFALADHIYALDVVLRPARALADDAAFTMPHVILAACVIGVLMTSSRDSASTNALVGALGLADIAQFPALVNGEGRALGERERCGLVEAVHASRGRVEQTLMSIGGGVLPTVLLLPGQAMKLPGFLFAGTRGRLPALGLVLDDADARRASGAVLLGLAHVFQDAGAVSSALICFYLALGLHPTSSSYNNAGILVSALGATVTALVTDDNGHSRVQDAQTIARAYYTNGLALDDQHPHLLTNLGSLMKDRGQIGEAIQMYNRAIQAKPDFDVALANMANAVKDLGRTSEAIDYYRRAVAVNPDFPEALCGYVSALCAVCDWRGRGTCVGAVHEHLRARYEPYVDDAGQLRVLPRDAAPTTGLGLMNKLEELCEMQLRQGYSYGAGALKSVTTLQGWLNVVERALGHPLAGVDRERWTKSLARFYDDDVDRAEKCLNEGAFAIQLVEYLMRIVQRRWYVDAYGVRPYLEPGEPAVAPVSQNLQPEHARLYHRPRVPASLGVPPVSSVLPFHAFVYPLSIRRTRLLSYRSGVRISHMALTQPWLPEHVYPPPAPRHGKINIGYVSGDLNNHPLAHLMQSVFGFHDLQEFSVFVYATSASDGSSYRRKIENESEHFLDCSSWTTAKIVNQIIADGIHVLINLGGYTKGCRNDILAARPAPVQISVMGFAGTLGAGWSDYLLTDVTACPPETSAFERWRQRHARHEETSRIQDSLTQLERETDVDVRPDPESLSEEWMYSEKLIYMPYSYFVNDHKQSFRRDDLPDDGAAAVRTTDPERLWQLESSRRLRLRQVLFSDLHESTIIFANFNQLYKIDPVIFATWLRILKQVPNSILWLLRFPASGEENLLRSARMWAGDEISSRIRFTDVAAKEQHIQRGRIADLFLDTVECCAHTTATDVLWSGTPILTWPKYKYKMCSRVGASIARATGYGAQMIVSSLAEYEARAVALAQSPAELSALRRALYLGRDAAALFDTRMWTRHLEGGIREAWRRWVEGTEFEGSEEWENTNGPERISGSIWINPDGTIAQPPKNIMP